MYENHIMEDNNGSGMSPISFLLGVAVGVVATVAFAAYQEEKFNLVVRKSRELGDKASEAASDVKDRVSETAQNVKNSAKDKINQVRDAASDQIESARKHAGIS